MRRMVSATAFLVGLGLLASAYLTATASPATGERVLRLNVNSTDIRFLDPALNYDFYGWRLEAATCAMLLGYPDKRGAASARLYAEVARGFPKVTNGGRMYTFTIRPGFRFSDGTAVTAASYARAFERALSPKMQSPAASFLGDVVGASAVLAGKATTPSGVRASGNTLTVRLTKAGTGLPLADRDAVLLRGAGEPAHQPERREHAARRRAVLRREQDRGGA